MPMFVKCDRCSATATITKLALPNGWFDIKGLPTEHSSQQLCPDCVAMFLSWVDPQADEADQVS